MVSAGLMVLFSDDITEASGLLGCPGVIRGPFN